MDEVKNDYIDGAITHLLSTIGIKEQMDSQKLLSLVNSNQVKEAIKEIARYLGLPIEVKLSYVPKGYKPSPNDGFQSTHLVKTDWKGRGTGGITAQVSIPSTLPLYGTPTMINFPINVRLSENCTENASTLISIMAHELSHIVLHSLWHKEKENEFYTDLTAMMLGFSDIMKKGRKVYKTETFIDHTTTETTTYGYLSDSNFDFAYSRIKKILATYRRDRDRFLNKVKNLEEYVKKQKTEAIYFKRYLKYVGTHLNQEMSSQDGIWISTFHQSDYTEEFDHAIRNTEAELKHCYSIWKNISKYTGLFGEDIKNYEHKLNTFKVILDSKFDRVRGAVIILKKYVSKMYRLESFMAINFSSAL